MLLPTGRTFDVIEAPAYLGQRATDRMKPFAGGTGDDDGSCPGRSPSPPPAGGCSWSAPAIRSAPSWSTVSTWSATASAPWIPAPPTKLPEGTVRWAVAPEHAHWRLPNSYAVQNLLVDASEHPETGRGSVDARTAAPAPSGPLIPAGLTADPRRATADPRRATADRRRATRS